VAHTYDANGNLTGDTSRTLTWDSRNRLASLTGPVAGTFSYDAMGRRKSKTVAGTGTSFLYDGFNIVQELNGANPQANLLTGQGIDEVFARTFAAGSENFVTDGLGSTVALTDAAGAVQSSYTYEAYGKAAKSGTATTNSQTYTGREDDGTGLYYYRARYYNPTISRFVSEDPIGLAGGINTYGYVGGNPVLRVDPYGEAALAIVGRLAELDALTPDPTDAAWPKWAGWAAAMAAAGIVDWVCKKDVPDKEIGPSGKPKRHFVRHPSRKKAKDAAQNEGQGPPMHHPSPARGEPHYHPTDGGGEKIPGVHHEY
jgi:RHS repeat-associated protein